MTLVKFRSRNDLSPWEYMDRMVKNFANEEDWPGFRCNWAPAVDISENDQNIVVRAEIPGINKDDVRLTVNNGTLTITGEKKQEKNDEKYNYCRNERMYGSFCRSFSLPSTIDSSKIKANYKDGILSISLPKVEAAKPKEIAIEAA